MTIETSFSEYRGRDTKHNVETPDGRHLTIDEWWAEQSKSSAEVIPGLLTLKATAYRTEQQVAYDADEFNDSVVDNRYGGWSPRRLVHYADV